MFTGNVSSYFVHSLKAIAKVLLGGDETSTAIAGDGDAKPTTNMTLFGLTDFVIAADELFESEDLTSGQYASLLNVIFTGHSSVQALFHTYACS